MAYIWSYLLMAFCVALTSAGVIDFPGNRNSFPGNLSSGVKSEKLLTPPTDGGLIIDSNGFPGNSNDPVPERNSNQNLQPYLNEILNVLNEPVYDLASYEIIPFTKLDFINLENSEICKMMCKAKVNKPPCKCE